MPSDLKSGIENLSGMSMDDVKVHYNSARPAQMKAHAYAQGTDIHVASGQEKHLPHEAWHVVQQKQGRVKPTIQMKGQVNINDDAGLEREADVMGQMAVQRFKQDSGASGLQMFPKKSLNASGSSQPIQLMTRSNIRDYQQAGGTCGLYSLGMAISGVDPEVVSKRDLLLELLLRTGNDVGTFVGEFMDAANLALVGKLLGLTVNVIDFTDVRDFTSKLRATGSEGVVMGYSAFDAYNLRSSYPKLSTFKHLFNHWSVIEAIDGTDLEVRDPNDPGSIRKTSISDFYQSNQETENSRNPGKFEFQEFNDSVEKVYDLREKWMKNELGARGGNVAPATPLDLSSLPSVALNLKGKMVSVRGKVTRFTTMREAGKLRGEDKSVLKNLRAGDPVVILDKNKPGNIFDLGLISTKKRHYWVRTKDGTEGWVRSNALN